MSRPRECQVEAGGQHTSDRASTRVDRLFADPELAAMYDAMCRGRPDFAFYLPLVASADAVLDVGCGTGELLRRARAAGHAGRLCGLDPAPAILDCARRCVDIEWMAGDLRSRVWDREFSLVVMTGHAFQVLLTDDELRASLRAIRRALTDDGRFVFETRNPAAREWETWVARDEFVTDDGSVVGRRTAIEEVDGDRVRFTQTFTSARWSAPRTSTSTLRFLDRAALAARLEDAGLVVHEQFGDWNRGPVRDGSPEIITVARRA